MYFTATIKTSNKNFNFEKKTKKYMLSEREVDVLKLLLIGRANYEIAKELFISINTVKTHVKNIYKKTHVKNRMLLSYKFIPKSNNHPSG